MDLKKVGLISGGSVLSLLVLLILAYLTYPFIHPEEVEKVQAKADSTSAAGFFYPEMYNPEKIDSLNVRLSNFQSVIDSLNGDINTYQSIIDSLSIQVEELKKVETQDKLAKSDPESIKIESETVAKSLLNLDEDALAPIVNLLDDEQLIKLYSKASSLEKEKLLRSLKPQKAARILKEVMS